LIDSRYATDFKNFIIKNSLVIQLGYPENERIVPATKMIDYVQRACDLSLIVLHVTMGSHLNEKRVSVLAVFARLAHHRSKHVYGTVFTAHTAAPLSIDITD
jgi:hypothetical protein